MSELNVNGCLIRPYIRIMKGWTFHYYLAARRIRYLRCLCRLWDESQVRRQLCVRWVRDSLTAGYLFSACSHVCSTWLLIIYVFVLFFCFDKDNPSAYVPHRRYVRKCHLCRWRCSEKLHGSNAELIIGLQYDLCDADRCDADYNIIIIIENPGLFCFK